MIKKNHFITLLLITFALNTHAMAPENNPNKQWISFAADVILYSTDGLREFLSYIHSEPIATINVPESQFASFPKDIQQTIIFLLSEHTNATTLKDAAHAINSLAQVNKQLNELINDPNFCLQIIKRLAQQFNCSDETAAAALQTAEAKNRLAVQKQFKKLFAAEKFDEKLFNELYKKQKGYVDLNFTYRYTQKPALDFNDTLLIIAVSEKNSYSATKVHCLLKTKAIDINYQNKDGMTALIGCVKAIQSTRALEFLCTSPNIKIDLQDKYQSTALHYACWHRNKKDKFEYIKILLKAGADPEIANDLGLTPLIIIRKTGDDDDKELNLIQEAIQKKHEKK